MTSNNSSPRDQGINLDVLEQRLVNVDDKLAQMIQLLNQTQTQSADSNDKLTQMIALLNQSQAENEVKQMPRDCLDIQRAGFNESGQYKVYPDDGGGPFFVFCDMETDGGGWTVREHHET